jgi:hypothetical protein
MGERKPLLLVTDPPYGIELDSEWRDRAGLNSCGAAEPSYMKHRVEGHTETTISGDTRAELKWMKQPEFDAAYREARGVAFRQAVARLQQASGAAVSTLLKIMVDQSAPHSTRVRAADSVLDHAGKAIEIEDIEARVTELERAAELAKSSVRG